MSMAKAARKPFPARVDHRPDEPAHGLLLRTAYHNGARRLYTVFERFGASGGFSVSKVDPREVALACKNDPDAVAHASPVVTPKSVALLGEVIHRDHFSVQNRRWCPLCLTEEAYHRAWWDVMAVTTCPRHSVALATRCGCGRPLAWRNQFPARCRKGHDLTRVACEPLSPDETAADAYVVARLTGTPRPPVPLLDTLPLGEAIIAMERVGKAWVDEDRGIDAVRAEGGVRRLLTEGFRVLAGHPATVEALLDRLKAGETKRKGRWGTMRAYGEFHLWVARLPHTPLGTALKEAVERHARTHVVLKTGHRLAGQGAVAEGLTLLEAAEACGMSHERFRRIAVETGLMPARKLQGEPVRLDPAVVADLAQRLRGHKNLDDVCAEFGVPAAAVRRLVASGLLTPLAKGRGRGGMNTWVFPEDAAAALLGRLRRLARAEAADDPMLAPLPRAAQVAHTSAAQVIELILEGRLAIHALDPQGVGLQGLLVSKREAKRLIRKGRLPGHTLQEACALLGLHMESGTDYVRRGVLAATRVGRVVLVSDEEVERFRRTYVTVPELGRTMGLASAHAVIAALNRQGVRPACTRPPFRQILYDRGAVFAAIGETPAACT